MYRRLLTRLLPLHNVLAKRRIHQPARGKWVLARFMPAVQHGTRILAIMRHRRNGCCAGSTGNGTAPMEERWEAGIRVSRLLRW